jgi:hypothetical protein
MIRPDLRSLLPGLVLLLISSGARADWIDGERARLQALDKITARISTLQVPIDTPVLFGTLRVTVRRCAYHPPEEPPEDAAFLQIVDHGYDSSTPPREVFGGWMFSSSPAVSAMEHPVYDITLLSCESD